MINYTYVVTSHTSGTGTLLSLVDNKVSLVSCPTTAMPPSGTITCTGSYTTTAADVVNGTVANTATVTGDSCNDGCNVTATAQATITFLAQPSWTLAKTASPTMYAPGQAIAYSYVLSNTGNVGITGISVSDNKIASVICPATTLAVGGNMTCTGSYTTTAADVTSGTITNTAIATGTPAGGTLAPATAQATITAIPAGSITIVKTATGGDNSFNFASTFPGAASFNLVTVNGTASRSFPQLQPGSYSVSETNLPQHWKLSGLTCSGGAAIDLANRSAAITLGAGQSITCTFANQFEEDKIRTTTQQVIQNFLSNRNELLVTHEPDRSRFTSRVTGSLWGDNGSTQNGGGSSGTVAMSGSDGDQATRLSFATSLAQMALARTNPAPKPGEEPPMALGASAKPPRAAPAPATGFDVWVEGHFSDYRDKSAGVHSKGHFGVLYLGADYLITPAILVGALVQFDWAGEKAGAIGSSVDGQGYMAGPYVGVRLGQNLFFDARAAWGSSDNTVNPFGTYDDRFTTDRWLAHANLTGNWRMGNFRFTPSLGYTFVEEKQHGYVDTLGVFIPSQTVSLGRISFGPEIAYRHRGADGIVYEPHVSVKGVWDDTKSRSGLIGGFAVSDDDFRALAQAGITLQAPGGLSVRLVGSYDGLASSSGFRDVGGQAWVNVPLN